MSTDDLTCLSPTELALRLDDLLAELDDLEAQQQAHIRQTGLHAGLGEFRRQQRFYQREMERLRADIAAVRTLLTRPAD